MIRRRVVVSGQVQGVFFRDSCERQAHLCGVNGWVRNLADGRVEAAFEGEDDAVESMVRWARAGPRRAVVDHLEMIEEQPEGEHGFRVR